MNLDHVFKKTKTNKRGFHIGGKRPEVPEGLLRKCNKCGKAIFTEDVKENYYICPKCKGYFRVNACERIKRVADEDSFIEWEKDLAGQNPLNYEGYEEKLAAAKLKSGLREAVVTGKCKIHGETAVLCVMDGSFMMASMGVAVGEKITRAVEKATEEKLPVIIFTCSGGARMQEGIHSLMQMAKTSAVLKRHSDAGLLYISVLTDPTTGGVTASFAMEGDIILAEPKALIGFAGPRVIEQTIGQKLPKGFQRSEFLLEHGFVDQIVVRKDLRKILGDLLAMHVKSKDDMSAKSELDAEPDMDVKTGIHAETDMNVKTDIQAEMVQNLTEERELTGACISDEKLIRVKDEMNSKKFAEKSAWERVQLARDKKRPTAKDYIEALFEGFYEFHGDRLFADDSALTGGIAYFQGQPVTVIAQEKGRGTKENIAHNFGMCSPDGYRKALRLMRQAEKFGRPVICLVDTPGAYCGLEAEERGQGEAIARNIYEMSALKVPIVTLMIGEGGSGGALALATSNEVWMMENAIYSILSPEGFASILWKDSSKAKRAAQCMKLTAKYLLDAGVVEYVFAEPENYTKETMGEVVGKIRQRLAGFLDRYNRMSAEEICDQRYERFRKM